MGLEKMLAVVGLVLALLPRTAVETNLRIVYENADELQLQPWVVPATRLLGGLYVVAGLFTTPVDGRRTEARQRDERT